MHEVPRTWSDGSRLGTSYRRLQQTPGVAGGFSGRRGASVTGGGSHRDWGGAAHGHPSTRGSRKGLSTRSPCILPYHLHSPSTNHEPTNLRSMYSCRRVPGVDFRRHRPHADSYLALPSKPSICSHQLNLDNHTTDRDDPRARTQVNQLAPSQLKDGPPSVAHPPCAWPCDPRKTAPVR